MKKKPKVYVNFTDDEVNLLNKYMERVGLPLDEWIRKLVMQSIPIGLKETIYPPPPPAPTPPEPPKPEPPPVEKFETNHPCVFLLPVFPHGHRYGDCEGTCTHSVKQGLPCKWNAGVARNCQLFKSRVHTK